jgi:hypothetical protein
MNLSRVKIVVFSLATNPIQDTSVPCLDKIIKEIEKGDDENAVALLSMRNQFKMKTWFSLNYSFLTGEEKNLADKLEEKFKNLE